ncbi:MoaD/ThiS family protein [Chloroflexota bacterium]
MVVLIEFLGMQRVVTQTGSMDITVTEKMSVNDALEYVRNRYPDLNLDEGTILVTVNQEIAPLDRILKANDTVSFLPFISGG